MNVKHLALPFWCIHVNIVVLHIRKPVLRQKKKGADDNEFVR